MPQNDQQFTSALTSNGDQAAAVQAVAQLAREHADPVTIEQPVFDRITRAFMVPSGARLEVVDREPDPQYMDQPLQMAGHIQVHTVQALKDYIAEFYETNATTVWVDELHTRVTAILNDADGKTAADPDPGWRDHRAELQLRHTPEWTRWIKHDSPHLMSQQAFAEHIEESELDVQIPDAAELLEIAQTISATTTAEFRSGMRLKSGEVQFEYVQEQKTSAGRKGDLSIPDRFELLLAPFVGEEPLPVTALLRYRLNDGNLTIGYKLVRPEQVIKDAIQSIANDLGLVVRRTYVGQATLPGR